MFLRIAQEGHSYLPVSSSEPERRRGYDGQERNATDPSEVDRKHDFFGNAGNRHHDADHRTDGQRTDHAHGAAYTDGFQDQRRQQHDGDSHAGNRGIAAADDTDNTGGTEAPPA